MFNDFYAILPYFVRCIGCWPGSEVIDLLNRYSLDPGDTCECLGLKCRCSKRKTVAPGLKRGWQEPKRKMHKNAGSHWKFASTKGDHRLKSYGCLDADLPLPRSGEDMSHMHYLHHIYWYLLYCINLGLFSIHFHPFPSISIHVRVCRRHSVRLQAILSFFHLICPTKLGREVPTLFRRQWAWTPSWARSRCSF